MEKNYQTVGRRAGTTGRTTPKKARIDLQRSAHEAALTLPDTVSVAVAISSIVVACRRREPVCCGFGGAKPGWPVNSAIVVVP